MNDYVGGIIVLIIIGFIVGVGFCLGMIWEDSHLPSSVGKQYICQKYLHDYWDGKVCIDNGVVVKLPLDPK